MSLRFRPPGWPGRRFVVASIRDTGDMLTPAQRRLQRMVCRLADCVLVNAEAIRETLIEQGYAPGKIVVIRNGITLSKFAEEQRDAVLRQELGLPLSARLVAVFSRLNRMKGVEYFLDAAMVLAGRFPDVRFLVVGDGESRKELEEHACRLGLGQRIVFTGFRSDVPDLLSEAAVSVLPSLSEGTLEFPARIDGRGRPRDRHQGGGQSGGHRRRGHRPACAAAGFGRTRRRRSAVCWTTKTWPSRFGQAGMRRVAELFSMERSVRETEHLYQRLVEAKGAYENPADWSASASARRNLGARVGDPSAIDCGRGTLPRSGHEPWFAPGWVSAWHCCAMPCQGWTLHLHTNGHNLKSWLLALGCGLAGQARGGCILTLHSGMVPGYLRDCSSLAPETGGLCLLALYASHLCEPGDSGAPCLRSVCRLSASRLCRPF